LDSQSELQAARDQVQQVIDIHAKVGFQICNWVASDPAILEHIPEELRAEAKAMAFAPEGTERVLGLY